LTKLAEIAPHIRALQHRASDPSASVWVSANAGSGKTHVLAQRVLRHLLAGVAPAKILCLTFTKAAAANMAARVFDALATWTELDDAALAAAIAEIGAPPPRPETLILARRLFAQAVETPGGLKIQTIHAFCERLLHLFPFEANVPARFEVLDDRAQAELLARARKEILAEAQADHGDLGGAYAQVSEEVGQAQFEELIRNASRHRRLFEDRSSAQAVDDLRRALALAASESVASIEQDMIEGGIAPRRWRDFAVLFNMSARKSDRDAAAWFQQAAQIYEPARRVVPQAHPLPADVRARCLAVYCTIFFTDEGDGTPRARLVTKDFVDARPGIVQELDDEKTRLAALRDRRKAARTFERSKALIVLMQALFARYRRLKGQRGLLDFEDLIEKTAGLLLRSDARWVLYKLDQGIDHILVDEAQDTSEAQWKILEDLTGEFAAGLGARNARRTFFAVGDEKQSIFSFQGAAPHMFHAMRRQFERTFSKGNSRFEHVRLKHSFRSVPTILAAVDHVFSADEHQSGLVTDDQWMGHDAALKLGLPGLVEIWQPISANAPDAPADWQLPLDVKGEADPANILTGRVAQKIARLIAPGSTEKVFDMDRRARPIRPSDILILVRTRNAFFDAMIRALKQNRVPVAGADRLQLTEHIAVMDLMAVGRVTRLPDDDLGLACVLKSPLIGFDDDDLLRLAPSRNGSLFAALQGSDVARNKHAAAKIRTWMSRAALPPFAFYARLLGEDGGRRAMEARLGPKACDAPDEFLRLALEAERKGILSLATFLATFEGVDFEIKRDMETPGDCVRVMTVHAAKGLEAKVVFLPDTCSAPNGRQLPRLLTLRSPADDREIVVWAPRKDDDPPMVAAARAAARAAATDEYRRLLYVALTRAEERLYVCGFYGARKPDSCCWGEMIRSTLGTQFVEVPAFWNEAETILRHAGSEPMPDDAGDMAERSSSPVSSLPEWLWLPAPLEQAPAPPLKPSTALAAAEPQFDPARAARPRATLACGRLMHSLLQHLPQVAESARRKAAQRFLALRAESLDEREREALVEEVLAVFDLPGIGALFAPNARAEVAVAGRLMRNDGKVTEVAGQIDRVVETETEILVADFKTGTAYAADAIPPAFITQMALYRALLAPLWPKKRLVMLLIFANGGTIVELTDEQMSEALARLGVSSAVAA
jgi:ATP-dependent helicase/nuclease subunit A